MTDIVDLGSSTLDERTNALLVQGKTTQVGDSEDDAPDFGAMPILGALGVTGRPYPKTADGNAQGVVDDSLPGTNGWVVAARDTRCASVVAELGEGETALHSTGPGFDSRVFCKDQLAAMIVGNDCALVMDRENKKFSISIGGCLLEMSEENGIVLSQGGAMLQIKDGLARLLGQVVLGGATPLAPLLFAPAPVVGVTGTANPAPGVFIGA